MWAHTEVQSHRSRVPAASHQDPSRPAPAQCSGLPRLPVAESLPAGRGNGGRDPRRTRGRPAGTPLPRRQAAPRQPGSPPLTPGAGAWRPRRRRPRAERRRKRMRRAAATVRPCRAHARLPAAAPLSPLLRSQARTPADLAARPAFQSQPEVFLALSFPPAPSTRGAYLVPALPCPPIARSTDYHSAQHRFPTQPPSTLGILSSGPKTVTAVVTKYKESK